MTISVLSEKDEDYIPAITRGMNKVYKQMKVNNPLGYKDEFEARMELTLVEVVENMGGTIAFNDKGEAEIKFL